MPQITQVISETAGEREPYRPRNVPYSARFTFARIVAIERNALYLSLPTRKSWLTAFKRDHSCVGTTSSTNECFRHYMGDIGANNDMNSNINTVKIPTRSIGLRNDTTYERTLSLLRTAKYKSRESNENPTH